MVARVSRTSCHQRVGWKRSVWIWQLPVSSAAWNERMDAFTWNSGSGL